MPPDDPLGKNGPTLDQFLRKKVRSSELPKPCPYGKKCTYGNKCKFYHPDRAPNQKNISDKLKEYSSPRINEVRARGHSRDSSPGNKIMRKKRNFMLKNLQFQEILSHVQDQFNLSKTVNNWFIAPNPQFQGLSIITGAIIGLL